MPIHGVVFGLIKQGVETLGPIIIREIATRTPKFVEQQFEGLAQEIARRRFTQKGTKKIIIRRGKTNFLCRRMM